MSDTEQTSRIGVNAVGGIFLDLGWIFREQPVSDFGVDAQAEIKEGNQATGRLIALQIKTGASYFKKRGKNFVYYGSREHLDYWTNHSLPVFLILHHPEEKLTLWQKIDRDAVEETDDGNWLVEIPPANILDRSAEPYLKRGAASTPSSIRRVRLAFDDPIIKEISRLAKSSTLFMVIDEWVNKTLNMRSVTIMLKDPDSDPVMRLEPWTPAPNINEYMNVLFPWLDYKYARDLEPDPSEVQGHVLEIWPNDLAQNFLAMEDYFREGRPALKVEGKYPDDGLTYDSDGEPFDEPAFRRAVDRDPYD